MVMTLLETLLHKYPEKSWDWYQVSKNPNISLEFVKNHKNFPWFWNGLSQNLNITLEEIDNNLSEIYKDTEEIVFEWDFKYLSRRSDMALGFINKYSKYNWDYEGLSMCTCISLEFIEKNINEKWNWHFYLSQNPVITIDFVLKHRYKEWNWYFLSQNFKLDDIEKHPKLDWDLTAIMSRHDLTIEYIEKYKTGLNFYFMSSNRYMRPEILEHFIDEDWTWSNISKYISLDFIMKYPELSWNYEHMSDNINVTMQFVEKNLNHYWNWTALSWNPHITMEFILKHSKPLNVYHGHPNITFDKLCDTPESVTKISELCMNPNITMEFIEDNITYKNGVIVNKDKHVDWNSLSRNMYDKYFEQYAYKHLECYREFPWVINKQKELGTLLHEHLTLPSELIREIVSITV